MHAWSAIGAINLYSYQGSMGCSWLWTTCESLACRGPLMRVCLWRSTSNKCTPSPSPSIPPHPAKVYPSTQPKYKLLPRCTPSPSPNIPPYPAKVYPSTQPKHKLSPSPSVIPHILNTIDTGVLRIMLQAGLLFPFTRNARDSVRRWE